MKGRRGLPLGAARALLPRVRPGTPRYLLMAQFAVSLAAARQVRQVIHLRGPPLYGVGAPAGLRGRPGLVFDAPLALRAVFGQNFSDVRREMRASDLNLPRGGARTRAYTHTLHGVVPLPLHKRRV